MVSDVAEIKPECHGTFLVLVEVTLKEWTERLLFRCHSAHNAPALQALTAWGENISSSFLLVLTILLHSNH